MTIEPRVYRVTTHTMNLWHCAKCGALVVEGQGENPTAEQIAAFVGDAHDCDGEFLRWVATRKVTS